MQRLILFRHGEALANSKTGRDIDRALSPAGEAAAARTASALAAAGLIPDIALVSGARRTTETWAAAAPEFGGAVRSETVPSLYNAGPETIMAVARARSENTVMVIGHNPGLQVLSLDLLTEQDCPPALLNRVEQRFPPATAAAFSFDNGGAPEFETLVIGGNGG